MQERRTTIRKNHYTRMQYCPAEDLELREGRLADVSERGAGLLTRERRRNGELVTLGFSLPGTEDTLTATGVIRWSGSESAAGNWHRVGLEWLPLEDATRNRISEFLTASKSRSFPIVISGLSVWIRRGAMAAGALVVLILGWGLIRWGSAVQQQNSELIASVQRRDAIINYLGKEGQRLKFELGEARRYLAETANEVARLDVQAQLFGRQVDRLTQDVTTFQQSYAQSQEERGQLMQRVLDLEQEKSSIARRLASVDELKLAIREAIESRKQTQQAERLAMLKTKQEAQERWLEQGNRGYLVKDGRPTVGRSTVWIRVHEPESVISAPPIVNGLPVETPETSISSSPAVP
jgi:archaellum component FlaC